MKQIKYLKLTVCFFAFLFIIFLGIKSTNAIYRDTKSATINLSIIDGEIICKKATTIHSEECHSASGNVGCRAAGYAVGEVINYGSIIDSDTLKAGDVFDCNVDGTGYNQRFYYLRTLDNKAVLIYYTNFEGESGPGSTNNYTHDVAHSMLPTTTQWDSLPVTFEVQTDDYRPARFITYEDLEAASGKTNLTTTGVFDDINFIFENTTYANTTGHSTVWLEDHGTTRYRYHKDERKLVVADKDSSVNAVRPIIEVPLSMIEDSYIIRFNPNGGTVTNEYLNILKGNSLGTLPTATNGTYAFGGWYTDTTYTTQIDANTTPNDYDTYYAKWVIPVSEADLASTSMIMEEEEQASIVINNASTLEPYTFTSSDTSVATVDQNGLVTAISEGTAIITITGTDSQTTKQVTVTVTTSIIEYTVIFDSQGGTEVADMKVQRNTAIGTLPTTTRTNYNFMGWYTDTNWTTQVTEETIIDTDNTTFYAKWIPIDALVEMNGLYYETLQEALDLAPSSTQTTIKLLKDFTITSNDVVKNSTSYYWGDLYNKNTDKNIIFDLQGYTITNTVNENYIIRSKATIEIKNGTIINSANGKGAVESNDKSMTINNMTITATGNRQAAYIDTTGSIIIKGNSVLTANALIETGKNRGTVQCASSGGKLTILSATISSDTGYAVANTCNDGNLVIGQKDGLYDTESIVISGGINGVHSTKKYALYDGMIRGVTAAVNNEANINLIEDDATKVKDTANGYNRLYYTVPQPPSNIRLTLNADGGEVTPTYVIIELGDPVGELPTPTKGIYTFEGWYTEDDEEVLSTRIPETDETYHAVWSYDSSDEIIEHDIMPAAVRTYFDNISTWASGATDSNHSSFDTAMMNNFNSNNCKYFKNYDNREIEEGGSIYCDQPNPYDTGMVETIKVYKSNAAKEKGDEATYVTANNGKIYNMIPGEIYKWELASDSNVYGYVKAIGERRLISIDNNIGINKMRNVRDLGGIKVDQNGDGTIDGTIKYGILYRGERIINGSGAYLNKLGIQYELDLRTSTDHGKNNEDTLTNNITNGSSNSFEIRHYIIDYENYLTNYNTARAALTKVMTEIVNTTDDDYAMFFHCRIGADRTGTLAYLIEGILGAPEEERYRDYELTLFYGFRDRTRFYTMKPGGEEPNDKKFVYLKSIMLNNNKEDVYDWYMKGSTDTTADDALIQAFKTKMIDNL